MIGLIGDAIGLGVVYEICKAAGLLTAFWIGIGIAVLIIFFWND